MKSLMIDSKEEQAESSMYYLIRFDTSAKALVSVKVM